MAEVPRQPPPGLGRAIRRTDAARAEAARVTDLDVLSARLLWHEAAPPGWQGLIEARVSEDQDRPV